ncbi:MAG TPA: hypothetical protein PLO20_10260, partial [Thermogutta sp.]|nr:hypothetical protein [Thermogutta sp.]
MSRLANNIWHWLVGVMAFVTACLSGSMVWGQVYSSSAIIAPYEGVSYRLVYQTVYEPVEVTAYRLECETQYEQRKVVTYKPVWETEYRERR